MRAFAGASRHRLPARGTATHLQQGQPTTWASRLAGLKDQSALGADDKAALGALHLAGREARTTVGAAHHRKHAGEGESLGAAPALQVECLAARRALIAGAQDAALRSGDTRARKIVRSRGIPVHWRSGQTRNLDRKS